MLSKAIISASVVVYAAVLTSVLLPGKARGGDESSDSVAGSGYEDLRLLDGALRPLDDVAARSLLPLRGAGMQLQRVDWVEKYKQSIDEIAALGFDTVSLVVDSRQEHGRSNRIYLDLRMSPTPDQLTDIIKHAKAKGLRVILMPIVLLDNPKGDEWRGQIEPDPDRGGWSEWWDSYRAMITHFAWVAQGAGVDVFVVGSELVNTEKQHDQWTRTIQAVRKSFKGLLTYSANWDHYQHIRFWEELDLVATNCYYKLGPDHHVTVEQISAAWKPIREEILAFARRKGKPFLFTEVGWCSMENAAHEPWDYTKSDPIDLDLQSRLYEGFFQSWHGNEGLGGFVVWEWTPGDSGPNDRGYTPEAKPAEKVLREWLAKPKWHPQ